MDRNEQILKLNEAMQQVSLTLTELQADQLLQYYNMIVEWNQKVNLTSITEFDQVVVKHFADSLSLCKVSQLNLSEPGQKLIDVGTGAGFPGIPLKIAFPSLQITLLDSLGKRVRFLEIVIEKLGLYSSDSPIEAIHGRAEDIGKDSKYRECYDIAVSRAVSNISTISEYCSPFLKKNGVFVAYKSAEADEEIKQYGNGLKKTGAVFEKTETFFLKDGGETLQRTLVVIRKEKETPEKYPRRAGMPEKRPLK